MSRDEVKARSVGCPASRLASPSRSSQHGSAVRSAVVSCTRSSRGEWRMGWSSRSDDEGDLNAPQGNCIVPLYLPPQRVSVRFSHV